jgi:hypothetical protein
MKRNQITLHSRAVNTIRAFNHNFVDGGGVIDQRRCKVENCRQPRRNVEWAAADDCSESCSARLCTNQQQSGEWRMSGVSQCKRCGQRASVHPVFSLKNGWLGRENHAPVAARD